MKKYIIHALIMFFITASFIACSDDDDKTIINDIEKAKTHAGFYKGKMNVLVDDASAREMWQQAHLEVVEGVVYLTIKSFWVNDINFGDFRVANLTAYETDGGLKIAGLSNVSFENLNNVNVQVDGLIKDGKMNLTFSLRSINIPSIYSSMEGAAKRDTIIGEKNAQILSLNFDDERILIQPEIDEQYKMIRFFVADTITSLTVDMKPLLELNNGASVQIDGDINSVDFAKGDVKFTVLAPDLIHRHTYTVRMAKAQIMKHEFDAWEVVPSDETNTNLKYSTPSDAGWMTDNESLRYLKTQGIYSQTAPYLVEETSDAVKGTAAKITNKYVAGATPALQVGLLYTGEQLASNTSDPLHNGKYGTAFKTKPIRITGSYKYTAGTKYYKNGTIDASANDSCMITAVLYEVKDYTESLMGANIYSDPSVVAFSYFVGKPTSASKYVDFQMDFYYIKSFYFSKKYKLAILCTPSNNGFANSGAENSTLWVDDFQIFSQDDYRIGK